MNSVGFVKEALEPFAQFRDVAEQVAVPTHCLYPSHAVVTVYVTGGPTGATVSDEGGAVDELTTHNRIVSVLERDRLLRRFCKPSGLKTKGGTIYSPAVPKEALASSILHVANASAAAARWGLEHIKVRQRRNLRRELQKVLERHFELGRIDMDRKFTGKSTRLYRFDRVVRIDHRNFLIIDTVLPDPNSINARTVAHLDLKQLEDKTFIQRMVYDDEEEWASADLNLLQMAATLVPLSQLDSNLDQFVHML